MKDPYKSKLLSQLLKEAWQKCSQSSMPSFEPPFLEFLNVQSVGPEEMDDLFAMMDGKGKGNNGSRDVFDQFFNHLQFCPPKKAKKSLKDAAFSKSLHLVFFPDKDRKSRENLVEWTMNKVHQKRP